MHRVLIVDDDRTHAVMATELVTARGHLARCAFDGTNALAIAGEFHPDLVLLDIALPGMNGWEIGRRILGMHLEPPPRLVAITAFADSAHRARSLQLGFAAHLVKPLKLRELDEVLATPAT